MADLRRGRDRRFGLFLQTNLASVPAWAPIGLDASRYLEYLADPDFSIEVQAHHRSRWDHVQQPTDFLPLLHFELFDPERWVDLAVSAGMSHIVQVAKDSQGVCWWDAPVAQLNVIAQGPQRDVAGAIAAACQRAGLSYGSAYSLGPEDLDPENPDERRNLRDLVERLGSTYLWRHPTGSDLTGSDPTGSDLTGSDPTGSWATLEGIITRLRHAHPDLLINDLWGLPHPDRTTGFTAPPPQIDLGGWELVRGLGAGRGHNRAETAQHQLSPIQIVALLTEVLAKGGNLLLAVGSGADGQIPVQAEVALRAAGAWITAHRELIEHTVPWETWGSDTIRYLRSETASDDRGDCVWAVDLSGRGEFAALGQEAGVVTEVTGPESVSPESVSPESVSPESVRWVQDAEGLRVVRTDRAGAAKTPRARRYAADPSDIGVYRVRLQPPERITLGYGDALFDTTLFDTTLFDTTLFDTTAVIEIADVLSDVGTGAVVQLGEATYRAAGPLPTGVTLRGLGVGRTKIQVDSSDPLEACSSTRIEFAEILPITAAPGPLVRLTGHSAVLLGVRVAGPVHVLGSEHTVRGSELQAVIATEVDRLTVSRCQIIATACVVPVGTGKSSGATGVEIYGGTHHLIESCELAGHQIAISCHDADHVTVRGNSITGGHSAIRVRRGHAPHVVGNSIRFSTRAVDIDAGSGAVIDANAVADGDSGCVVHNGATAVVVSGNHWQHCRIGLLLWSAGEVVQHSNVVVNLLEPEHALLIGP
jgi:alpha-L-fucosidase